MRGRTARGAGDVYALNRTNQRLELLIEKSGEISKGFGGMPFGKY